jgi:hypothetical protein
MEAYFECLTSLGAGDFTCDDMAEVPFHRACKSELEAVAVCLERAKD